MQWFSSYMETLVERNIRDLADIRAVDEVPALLALVASRSTGRLKVAGLAGEMRHLRTIGPPVPGAAARGHRSAPGSVLVSQSGKAGDCGA